jgi:hypothetical protein
MNYFSLKHFVCHLLNIIISTLIALDESGETSGSLDLYLKDSDDDGDLQSGIGMEKNFNCFCTFFDKDWFQLQS